MTAKLSQSVMSKKSLLVLVTFGLFIVIQNFSIKFRTFDFYCICICNHSFLCKILNIDIENIFFLLKGSLNVVMAIFGTGRSTDANVSQIKLFKSNKHI